MQNWLKAGIVFVLVAIVQRVLDRFLDWTEPVFSSASLSMLSSSDVLLIVMIIIGGLLIAIGLWKSKSNVSKPKMQSFDPKFNHVSARLFYPPKRRWHTIRALEKHWWEIWKQISSRNKLILVKDLKKAYWVGKYGWNLIIEGKIEWISEEDQDLDRWCKKNGYTPIHEVADEDKLLDPYFQAEIKEKKSEYHLGEVILFRTHYRGELTNGFFSNQIFAPTDKIFADGLNRRLSFPFDTLESGDPNIQGKLDGYVNYLSDWHWGVPLDAPLGQYRVYMRVHNHFRADNRPVVNESQDSFVVVSDDGEERNRHRESKQSYDQTKTELLKALHFFPEHWETYKRLIKSRKLESPQSGEIKWCSDQIKSAIIRARILNLNKINTVIPQIEVISNDMALFGVAVQTFPHHLAFLFGDGKDVILDLISRGDSIYKELQRIIQVVEQSFGMEKAKIGDVPNMFVDVSKVDKVTIDKLLIEVYSPIHAMIVRIYSEVSRSPIDTVGPWVDKSLIDVSNISTLFTQHVHELGDNNLKMWLEIGKEIKARNGFFLGKDRQKWFDELETEYNRLTKH